MSSKDNKDKDNANDNPKFNKNTKLHYDDSISDIELETHLKLLKQWLVKYNTFDFNNQSAGKLSTLNIEEIQIILNYKTNFARVKLYIDFLELEQLCPKFAISFQANFLKYYKYINYLTRRILLSSKKIKEDTSVFSDFIILNYPFIYSKVTQRNFLSILQASNGIIGFSKCFVTHVNPPTFLLWAKKIYKTCQCNTKEYRNKFFNVFTKNIKLNSKFQSAYCKECHKDYYHDKKADVFIECQEIELTIQTESGLINNCIKVWAFGDLINSVKEGDCISLIAHYIPEGSHCFEKEFEYGYFIALNFNLNFISLNLLKANDFLLNHHHMKRIGTTGNDSKSDNSEERSLSDLLRSLQFQRQFTNDFFKFILQNWQCNTKRELDTISLHSPYVSNSYIPFINIILDISLAQRDYANHNSKLSFLSSNNANYLVEVDNSTSNSNSNIIENSAITNSYNVIFKSKIFDMNHNYNHNPSVIPSSSANALNLNEDTFKKYFRLSKSISTFQSKGDMLLSPFNLFFIFDDLRYDPLYCQLKRYAVDLHKEIVVLYPHFTNCRFDKQVFIKFLYQCNGKILLVQNIDMVSKQEAELIGSVMAENASGTMNEYVAEDHMQGTNALNTINAINDKNGNCIGINSHKGDLYGLNITFWFCCSANRLSQPNVTKSTKSSSSNGGMVNIASNASLALASASSLQELKLKNFDIILSKCEGVFNCSKRRIKLKGIDIINEHSFTSFFKDINEPQLNSDSLLSQYKTYDTIARQSFACDTDDKHKHTLHCDLSKEGNSFKAAKLLEDYFIAKRDITRIHFDDLFTLLRIAILASMLRAHYDKRKIILPLTISNMNVFDSLIAIILYEEFTGYKYGNDTQSLGVVNDKILFYDYNGVISQVKEMTGTGTGTGMGVKTKGMNDGSSRGVIPKTKAKMAKKVEMEDKDKEKEDMTTNIFNLINNVNVKKKGNENQHNDHNKTNDLKCHICNVIDKSDHSNEVFFDFIEKVDTFIYQEKELI